MARSLRSSGTDRHRLAVGNHRVCFGDKQAQSEWSVQGTSQGGHIPPNSKRGRLAHPAAQRPGRFESRGSPTLSGSEKQGTDRCFDHFSVASNCCARLPAFTVGAEWPHFPTPASLLVMEIVICIPVSGGRISTISSLHGLMNNAQSETRETIQSHLLAAPRPSEQMVRNRGMPLAKKRTARIPQ